MGAAEMKSLPCKSQELSLCVARGEATVVRRLILRGANAFSATDGHNKFCALYYACIRAATEGDLITLEALLQAKLGSRRRW